MSDSIADIMARPAPAGISPESQFYLNQTEALKALIPIFGAMTGELGKTFGRFDELQKTRGVSFSESRETVRKMLDTTVEIIAMLDRMAAQPIPMWMQPTAEST